MNVSAESHVVSEIPAVVVGILIDDDVIAIPEPVATVANVIRSHAEIEAAEPEAVGAASSQMPDVAAAEAARKASVLPGMIKVIVSIVGASAMANPFAIGMDVRRIRMSGLVVEVRRRRRRVRSRSRAVRGDVPDPAADVMTLRQGEQGKQAANCQQSDKFFHVCPFCERPGRFYCWAGRGRNFESGHCLQNMSLSPS